MPLLAADYAPPNGLFRNAHVQTVYPNLLRRVGGVGYQRERIETDDGDFLDLDWSEGGAARLAILSHGLEGSTWSGYVRGMTRALRRHGWDVLAWNYRGCSGEPNRLLRTYHSGATEDLDVVVEHAMGSSRYGALALVGFSLGGNLTLKYVGERGADVHPRLCGAVAFSVPCDLGAGADHIARRANRLYLWRFLRSLHAKVRAKRPHFPDAFGALDLADVRTIRDFDDRFTAPVHGFEGAADYYAQSSCKGYLPDVRTPTLLVNAEDDPFLPPACYPVEEARASRYVHLQRPRYGGHVGFVAFNAQRMYWSERRAVAFLGEAVGVTDVVEGPADVRGE